MLILFYFFAFFVLACLIVLLCLWVVHLEAKACNHGATFGAAHAHHFFAVLAVPVVLVTAFAGPAAPMAVSGVAFAVSVASLTISATSFTVPVAVSTIVTMAFVPCVALAILVMVPITVTSFSASWGP